MLDNVYDQDQLKIIQKIKEESLNQKVPIEFALANAELESNFKNLQNSVGGQSFGPMQVNIVNLRPGESINKLKNIDFNIKRGVEILRRYLTAANGNTLKARIIYFCGNGMCGGHPPQKLITRWNTAAKKWAVPPIYPKFILNS